MNDTINGPANNDTVYIKAGEYKLSGEITLNRVLHLYGGFAGTEAASSDRNLDANETTLNANADNSNKHRVLNITTNSTFDGFTITGGNNNNNGGGFYINANPTITNCTITGNTAGSNGSYGGGGFYIFNASPTITNCTITGNTAGNGGGFYISNCSPRITNCAITSNTANQNSGGFFIAGSPTIENCTISGNTAAYAGGVDITLGTPAITNCTIVNNNNTATDGANGKEIRTYQAITLRNTLMWNTDTANLIDKLDTVNITYDHCAYPNATGENNIAFNTWENPVSSDGTAGGVPHKVYLAKNNSVLYTLAGKGVSDDNSPAPAKDQIGKTRANPPSIGAAEISAPVLSLDITADSAISTTFGTAKTLTFTSIVSLDNKLITSTDYRISWDVSLDKTAPAISIDQTGKLTVGSATPVGIYEATVKAQATYTKFTTPVIKSNTAEKKVNITVESGDINLTLTSKTLPNGKVNTAYTEAQYFTATATPSSADLVWEIEGLPAGLNFDKGKISGTPTASGDFSVKVTVTAALTNYNTTSKDITASIKVTSSEESGNSGDSGGSGDSLSISKIKNFPAGIVNAAYTSANLADYFNLTGAPDESSITWTTNGTLPDGLSCTNGIISGTPTAAGTFNFNVVASVNGENTSIAASIIIYSDTLETQESDIGNYSDEVKAAVKTLVLTSIEDLTKVTDAFENLTTITISKDAVPESSAKLVINELPSNVTKFVITENTTLKSLTVGNNNNLTTVEAKSCEILESVDIAGNTKIESIDVSGSEKLKVFKANDCENLKVIDCSKCDISAFEVTNSVKLKSIDCSYNSILALNLPSEIFTELSYLNCASQVLNNWLSDVSLNFDEFIANPKLSGDIQVSTADEGTSNFANVSDLKAFDSNGTEIGVTTDNNGNIKFASNPANFIYNYDTAYNDQLMDVTVYAADFDPSESVGSSGGCDGCNAGFFGTLSGFSLGFLFLLKPACKNRK